MKLISFFPFWGKQGRTKNETNLITNQQDGWEKGHDQHDVVTENEKFHAIYYYPI
jgi:hypothetical protein